MFPTRKKCHSTNLYLQFEIEMNVKKSEKLRFLLCDISKDFELLFEIFWTCQIPKSSSTVAKFRHVFILDLWKKRSMKLIITVILHNLKLPELFIISSVYFIGEIFVAEKYSSIKQIFITAPLKSSLKVFVGKKLFPRKEFSSKTMHRCLVSPTKT